MSAVEYTSRDRVAYLTLADSAHGNPINQAAVDALAGAVRRARADDVHVVVLTGGDRAFSVGGDIRAFAAATDVEQMVDDLAESLHRVVSDLQRMDAVVVSAVRGVAAGAGLALAAAADLVVAAASARFTSAYTKIGFSPDGGSSLLTASFGLHRALWSTLLNPVITAEQAHAIGLVGRVAPDDEFDAAVAEIVDELRAGSRAAQVASKRLLREIATPAAEVARRREALSIRALAASRDGRAGVEAFLSKRAPEFPSSR
ncbi:enoyl-CoA hydratase/isomerase family protein [Nocardia higoensis]|uniref:enoyl-CoA hydratase/isomerase family protein n=1 Tax=Nocardia higoensis TaxID=228599 RepID=UPI0002D4079F|nr:enoyl-CoA hydratase-related protein [Nocardia higoensis]